MLYMEVVVKKEFLSKFLITQLFAILVPRTTDRLLAMGPIIGKASPDGHDTVVRNRPLVGLTHGLVSVVSCNVVARSVSCNDATSRNWSSADYH
jgi:hypothetical protein